ncbi:MAG: LytR C-terminal domain-containing protein [Gemmatimonadaceae bacterium]|nr:LytR C-terminal domain-containing protein [Gemmatimonadaceae bacterium]
MRGRAVVGVVALLLAAGGGAWWFRRTAAVAADEERPAQQVAVQRLVPDGTRIRVEVLNTTTTRGEARRLSLYLRDAGFDVVRFAGEGPPRDSTLVLDRSGHPEWAALVSKALGGAAVEARPDTSRYVDVTVLIGRVVRTPAEAFYP